MIDHSLTDSLLSVLMSWILTPSGASLSLLGMLFGVVGGVLRLLGQSVRLIGFMMKACVIFLVLWMLGGLLTAWGVPVRAIIEGFFAWLPQLVRDFGAWLHYLFQLSTQR